MCSNKTYPILSSHQMILQGLQVRMNHHTGKTTRPENMHESARNSLDPTSGSSGQGGVTFTAAFSVFARHENNTEKYYQFFTRKR